jgi:predicted transglutaminase-like cysteine proteinase
MRSAGFSHRLSIAIVALVLSFACLQSTQTRAGEIAGGGEQRHFGLDVFSFDAALASGWSSMYARHLLNGQSVPRWRSFVEQLRRAPEDTRFGSVNRYVNRARYIPDRSLWGVDDYWETPEELFRLGGDCEDFAIAKFFILGDAGIPGSRMRVVVLRPTGAAPAHAVLVVEMPSGPIVLDNLRAQPYPLSSKLTSRFAFAVNDAEMWVPRTVVANRR